MRFRVSNNHIKMFHFSVENVVFGKKFTTTNFANKISEIVWMGGVYKTDQTPFGNIDTGIAPGANPYAEWNVYWDPKATQEVLNSGIKIKMFPTGVGSAPVVEV